jgi:hypothetical protein
VMIATLPCIRPTVFPPCAARRFDAYAARDYDSISAFTVSIQSPRRLPC